MILKVICLLLWESIAAVIFMILGIKLREIFIEREKEHEKDETRNKD